jgi:uncharacterized cofD-like protein
MKIVCIGGGTGLHAMLSGLKVHLPGAELAAVVTMMDSGSNSGQLRDEYGYLPPGDVRQCLVALSDASIELRQLMQHRFTNGSLDGHVVGNMLLTALKNLHGDEFEAIKAMERILHLRGSVYPVTVDDAHVVAQLEDGTILRGEGKLFTPEHGGRRITRVGLEPQPFLFPPTRKTFAEADYIIIGPGGLHNSLLPNILVAGMVETLREAKGRGARIVLVVNTMTKHGDTDGFKASDFREMIQQALDGVKLDAVICNTGAFPVEQLVPYAAEKAAPVECDLETKDDLLVVTGDFVPRESFVKHGKPSFARHDPKKLAAAIEETIRLLPKQ